MNDSILSIDFEDVASSEPRSLLLDELTSRGVLVLEVTGLRGGDEEVVVGEETESGRLDVILEFAAKRIEREISDLFQDISGEGIIRTAAQFRPGRR